MTARSSLKIQQREVNKSSSSIMEGKSLDGFLLRAELLLPKYNKFNGKLESLKVDNTVDNNPQYSDLAAGKETVFGDEKWFYFESSKVSLPNLCLSFILRAAILRFPGLP